RQFLNRTVSRIFEINEHEHRLTSYTGNYDVYSAAKVAERKQWEQDYEHQQEELAELRKYVRVTGKAQHVQRASNDKDGYHRYGYSFQSKQNAVASHIRSAQTQLAGIEADLIPQPPKLLSISTHFSTEPAQANAVMLTIAHLTKNRGERCLFNDLNLTVSADSRILLIGPNGAGKTTLLKLILGLEKPTDGAVQVSAEARIGYLPQEPIFLDVHKTVIETYRYGHEGYDEDFIAQLLNYGLFRQEDITKQVGQLSVGQQRKLEIACLMAANPNLLLLDEPTNYISLDVLEAFESAIRAFPGPVIVTSHDRWFIQRFKGEVWEIAAGQLVRSS
ncbi:MAG: ATP-binding cassette domain-containing protein, partial [Ktedonobacteraceae bacterium]